MNQKVIPFLIGFLFGSCGKVLFHIGYWVMIVAAFSAGHYLK